MATHNFRKLDIWTNSMNLVRLSYQEIADLPNEERFGLKSQISRSAVSIPSNIAEGSGRNSNKEFAQFLSIALGSSYELETQLVLAQELFNINYQNLIEQCQQIQRMIFAFKTKLVNETSR